MAPLACRQMRWLRLRKAARVAWAVLGLGLLVSLLSYETYRDKTKTLDCVQGDVDLKVTDELLRLPHADRALWEKWAKGHVGYSIAWSGDRATKVTVNSCGPDPYRSATLGVAVTLFSLGFLALSLLRPVLWIFARTSRLQE